MSESPFEENNSSQITSSLITEHVNAVNHLGNNCAAEMNDKQTVDKQHFSEPWFGQASQKEEE